MVKIKKSVLAFVSLSLLISLTGFISAHTGDDYYSHHSMMTGMIGFGDTTGIWGFGFMWMFMWLFMILVIIALVLLIMWLIKQIQKPKKS